MASTGSAPAGNRDPSSTGADGGSGGDPSMNASRVQQRGNPTAATQALGPTIANKPKRRSPASRSAVSSREPSPTGTKSSQGPTQPTSSKGSASHSETDQPQPKALRSIPNYATNRSRSPRLTLSTSPPPSKKTLGDLGTLPAIKPDPRDADASESADETANLPSGMRTPRSNSNTALETVVESSLPSTPAIGTSRVLAEQVAALAARQPEQYSEDGVITPIARRKGRASSVASSIATSTAESESEGYRSEDKTPTGSVTQTTQPQKSFARRPTVVGKDGSRSTVQVETETVSSIPQVGLGTTGPPGSASLRSKKSTDTIRAPKKEKKRHPRTRTGQAPTNASSKPADIFAAKIAKAVDEANSSDSEETFVYESNPPESVQRPSSRFHSRTPSATSIGGPDPRGLRLPLLPSIDGAQNTIKNKMKFATHSLNKESSGLGSDGMSGDGMGTERGSSSRDTHSHHRTRNGGPRNGHPSILSEDGVFHRGNNTSNHPLRQGASSSMSSRQTSQPPSPKLPPYRNGNASKKVGRIWTSYEADVENEPDENEPLLRRAHGRRRPGSGSLRQLEHRQRGWAKSYAGCIVAVFTIIMIMTGVGGFLITTTNALTDVKVVNITDVLVSKQEIMLDLVVQAVNPNLIALTISNMDVNLFAKSSYVRDGDKDEDDGKDDDDDGRDGDDQDPPDPDPIFDGPGIMTAPARTIPRSSPAYRRRPQLHISDSVDDGTDPPDDLPGNDKETMLLGRIFAFDSALTFDGTPFRQNPSISVGEFRLAKPGNDTEEGGSARWERVLGHPFELIVRGVLKYQLPLSGRTRTAPISGSVMVTPDGKA